MTDEDTTTPGEGVGAVRRLEGDPAESTGAAAPSLADSASVATASQEETPESDAEESVSSSPSEPNAEDMDLPLVVACPTCTELASERDDWCAMCGHALRHLSVSPAQVLVTETSMKAEVEVTAQGVLPTTFVIPKRHLVGAPKWVTPQVVPDAAITLAPGDVEVLTFVFSPVFLPQGRGEGEEAGHFELPIAIASLSADATGRAQRSRATISMVSPSRSRVRPAYSQTRLLPAQRIERGALVAKSVELKNAGGHQTRLVKVYARDFGWKNAVDVDAGAQEGDEATGRMLAEGFVVCPPLSAAKTIAAGEVHSQAFAFKRHPEAAPLEGAHPFDVEIVFVLEDGAGTSAAAATGLQSRHEVACRLVGVVAPAPDVTIVGKSVPPVRTHGARTKHSVRLRNPGAAAVTIDRVDIARVGPVSTSDPGERALADSETSETGGASDWVRVPKEWNEPVTIEAGSERTLDLVIDPSRRSGNALKQAWGERQITLHHDGWQEQDERALSFRLSAELGEVVALSGAVVGIDFGTSSSAVSLLHGESGKAFALPLEPEMGRDELPSVLFYRGDDPPFLFGTEAENAAPLAYSNVVRSIKSVVAKDPDLSWAFLERHASTDANGKDESRLRTFQSVELLSRFLLEVKQRAEHGTRKLPHEFLDALDLTGRGVRLSNAVFTHPVEVETAALVALHAAAKAAGLVDAQHEAFDAFVAGACLDEALAAVLAFVFVLAGNDGGAAAPLRDKNAFTLLSVDVGGGTSDLALVSVSNLKSFLDATAQTVDVELIASGGEARLGGDDFDRALAEAVLDRLATVKEASGCDLDGVRRAIAHPSFESFRRAKNTGQEAHEKQVWTAASSLLRICEEKKRELSTVGQVQLTPFLVPWPGTALFAEGRRGVELTFTRQEANAIYAPLFERLTKSTDALIRDAGFATDRIDAVLFTGKGSRLEALTDVVMAALSPTHSRTHSPEQEDGQSSSTSLSPAQPSARNGGPIALRPGTVPAFDEKRCVAMGAAVWGDSRGHGGGWLSVGRRASDRLDASLAIRRGPRFSPVEGLLAGATLPATGVVGLGAPTQTVVLYRQGRAAFTFRLARDVDELTIVVEGRNQAHAMVDGVRVDATTGTP